MDSSVPGATNGAAPRVAVVDADRRVQQSLVEVLRLAGLDVVGSAGEVRAALELLSRERPDVLLVDPRLPDLDAGAALLSSATLAWPGIRIVVMGWTDGGESRIPPAAAYVSKSAGAEEFLAAALVACGC